MTEPTSPASEAVAGLMNPRGLSLERVAIRGRQSSVTLSGWRLTVASERGEGTITLVEFPDGIFHRGDGVFLGWPQDRLASAYAALSPRDESVLPETLQLG